MAGCSGLQTDVDFGKVKCRRRVLWYARVDGFWASSTPTVGLLPCQRIKRINSKVDNESKSAIFASLKSGESADCHRMQECHLYKPARGERKAQLCPIWDNVFFLGAKLGPYSEAWSADYGCTPSNIKRWIRVNDSKYLLMMPSLVSKSWSIIAYPSQPILQARTIIQDSCYY